MKMFVMMEEVMQLDLVCWGLIVCCCLVGVVCDDKTAKRYYVVGVIKIWISLLV